ncbi:ATP synthase F0 subunit C [Candidatus Acetothermia bacterium]|jgi:F-type H+-transporting ATPase subunit c|nr:ATP synthase F0 subunit C [Candidatus Acetothermia bacterium]MCI2426035.1 ATP synthase F0 subunit C [Candidatus Acetothermia bacterium]MCI2427713.1 ATP synthase F0 subunit C [Candidatus Acetothermia bacterium]MCI2428988.1 ATP synthase F0 subunit C [Candidatus Acetothermia bacterium]
MSQEVQQVVAAISGADLISAARYLAAGLCMGIGAFGPAIGQGIAAAHALDSIARQPEMAGVLTRTMILGQAIAETTGIYSLVVAIILLFVV